MVKPGLFVSGVLGCAALVGCGTTPASSPTPSSSVPSQVHNSQPFTVIGPARRHTPFPHSTPAVSHSEPSDSARPSRNSHTLIRIRMLTNTQGWAINQLARGLLWPTRPPIE